MSDTSLPIENALAFESQRQDAQKIHSVNGPATAKSDEAGAPRFSDGKLVKPAYVTIFHNGVLLHHRQEVLAPTGHRVRSEYVPHEAEGPILLQMHRNPVRYRNVGVRRLNLDDKR